MDYSRATMLLSCA